MQRIAHTDIATHIHVILTCMPKSHKSAGGWRGEQAVRAATAKIMALLERAAIYMPDDVIEPGGTYSPPTRVPGQFGVTEPWPNG